jgi:hypothetical protein
MCMSLPLSNHWLQARPGYALLFVLAPLPGLPEPKRWAKFAKANLMRKFVPVVIAASALFLAGCCTTPHASKWEYKVVSHPWAAAGPTPEAAREARQAFLNDLGKEGWVLIQMDGMLFYFKRPVK